MTKLNLFPSRIWSVEVSELGRILQVIIKMTISLIVIGLKKLLFSTDSLTKLLSDSLLSNSLLLDSLLLDSLLLDSSINQSHSKL